MSRGSVEPPSVFVYDLARGVAAFAVLCAHARGFIFADRPLQPALTVGGRLFFGLTALGHQAVIVFLVLSGLLVTGSVLDALRAGRWSPADFATARLIRLWIVLLPCLALGGIEDAVGRWWAPSEALNGSDVGAGVAGMTGRLDWQTFVGNVVFLQGFVTPVFGSNIPLWTLSIEAWCYAGLLAAACAWTCRRDLGRLVCVLVAVLVAVIFVLPPAFWALCPIWCFGAVTAWHLRAAKSRRGDGTRGNMASDGRSLSAPLLALIAGAIAVTVARVLAARHLVVSDYLLGLMVAAVLGIARQWTPRWYGVRRAARFAAGFSYALYLAHFPLLALMDAVVLHHQRLAWSGAALALWCAAVAVALLQAVALWWMFERHTEALRTAVRTWMRNHGLRIAAQAALS